jgi:general stress protein YciG
MDREKQRQIASKGGKAAHAKGTAHEFTREEAVEAGRKGGKAAHVKGTAHRFATQPNVSRTGEGANSGGHAEGQSPTEASVQHLASEPPLSVPGEAPYQASTVG